MDLNHIIPDNNENWNVKKNILYFKYIVNTPIAKLEDNYISVYLDEKIIKRVLSLIQKLMTLDVKFYLIDPLLIKNNIDERDKVRMNIDNYLYSLSSQKLFDGCAKIGFDYIQNLSSYIKDNQAEEIFQEEYKRIEPLLIEKYYEPYENKYFYTVKREDIRDFVSTLGRQMKINWIL